MTKDEVLMMALEALKANDLLINGTEKAGGLAWCIDGYYSDCFDIDPINEQTEKAITAIKEALAQPEQTNIERHEANVQKFLGAPQPEQEPVAWADLRKEAQQIVESKFLWKKFIDGTPLSNDIACWMAEFAQQYATTPQRTWVGLSVFEINDLVESTEYEDYQDLVERAEAKLKEKNT